MLDGIRENLMSLLAVLIGASGGITALFTLAKSIKLSANTKKLNGALEKKIEITQEGIVKAFQTTKFPQTWKIDVSSKIDTAIKDGLESIKNEISKNEADRTRLMLYIAKVLSYTAAYDKLSDVEKTELSILLGGVQTLVFSEDKKV